MVNWAETRVSAESATVRMLRIMMAACVVTKLLCLLLDGAGGTESTKLEAKKEKPQFYSSFAGSASGRGAGNNLDDV